LREKAQTFGKAIEDIQVKLNAQTRTLEEAEGKQRLIPLDSPLLRAARNVGTCFGD